MDELIFVYRLRYKGNLNQQGKKLHKNSFVTVNIFSQLKHLLESKCIKYKQQCFFRHVHARYTSTVYNFL